MTLEEKIKEAREKALAAQKSRGGGSGEWWKPEAGHELHFRVLEWIGHDECWIEYPAHYIDTPKGETKFLTCGGDECYTCSKVQELVDAGDKESQEVARRSRRNDKIVMVVIDWDHRERGPLLWEPKNTQSCGQWTSFLGIISNPDYLRKTYTFKEGRMLTMLLGSEQKTIAKKKVTMMTLKSLIPGGKAFPIQAGKTKEGYAILLAMKDGSKKQFKLPDLSLLMQEYDVDAHAEAWGEAKMDVLDESAPFDAPTAEEGGGFEDFPGTDTEGESGPEAGGSDFESGDADSGTEFGFDEVPPPAAKRPAPTGKRPVRK
jgi:hypothetical protein